MASGIAIAPVLPPPIFDQNGMLQGCLGISVPDFRLPEDDSDYVRLILEGAKEISLHMGWYQ